MLIFRRRDTRAMALVAAALTAALVLAWPGSWPESAGLAGLAVGLAVAAAALVCVLRRRLPPDLAITPIPAAEAARLVGQAGDEFASPTALVEFRPDWPRRHRLDVMLDGALAAQLMPGQAVLVPLPEGACALSFALGARRVTSERLNGIRGTTSGFAIRVTRASKSLVMQVDRFTPSPAPFAAGTTRLVRPAPPR